MNRTLELMISDYIRKTDVDSFSYENIKNMKKNTYDSEIINYVINRIKGFDNENEMMIKYLAFILFILTNFNNNNEKANLKDKDKVDIEGLNNICKSKKDDNDQLKNLKKEIKKIIKNDFQQSTNNEKQTVLKQELQKLKGELENAKTKIKELKAKYVHEKSEHDKSKKIITNLNKQVESMELENKKLDEDLNSITEELNKLTAEIKDAIENITQKDNTINEFEKNIEELKNRITNLLKTINNYETQVNEQAKTIETLKQKKKELTSKYTELKNKYASLLEEEAKKAVAKENEDTIKRIILTLLYQYKSVSTELMLSIIKENGLNCSQDELKRIISELRKQFNLIVSKLDEKGPNYMLKSLDDKKLPFQIINSDSEYIDILFASDFHINNKSGDFIRSYDALIDYATQNNIKYIFNLGDFFDFGKEGYLRDYNRYKEISEIISSCIKFMPTFENGHQITIGGNHDVWNTFWGEDFLQTFIDARKDFIFLDHEEALITITNNNNELMNIFLHHTDTNLSRNELSNRIKNINSTLPIIPDIYTFGHSHECYINPDKNVLVIPSLTVDRFNNGALHARFYFKNGTLSDFSYKPLTLTQTPSSIIRKLKQAGDFTGQYRSHKNI